MALRIYPEEKALWRDADVSTPLAHTQTEYFDYLLVDDTSVYEGAGLPFNILIDDELETVDAITSGTALSISVRGANSTHAKAHAENEPAYLCDPTQWRLEWYDDSEADWIDDGGVGGEATAEPVEQSTTSGSRAHASGLLYDNGFIYVTHNYAWDNLIHKVDVTDYTTQTTLNPGWGVTGIIKEGAFLWATRSDQYVKKITIATFLVAETYNITVNCRCLCSDGTFVFVGCVDGYVAKINIGTEAITSEDIGPNDFTSIIEDGDYLYVRDAGAGSLIQVVKATLLPSGKAWTIGSCSDGMAQDDDYVYLGRNLGTPAVVRCLKSTHNVVNTISPTGLGFCSGVSIQDSLLIYLDAVNNKVWTFDIPGLTTNSEVELINLDSSDPIRHIDSDGTNYHFTQYDTSGATPIIRVLKTDFTAPDVNYRALDSHTLCTPDNYADC